MPDHRVVTNEVSAIKSVDGKFSVDMRVYYEDTDATGIVYHARYVQFLERARTEWLRSLGWEQASLATEQGIVFVVAEMNLRFVQPAKLDDWLTVSANLSRFGGATMNFDQTVCDATTGSELVSAAVRIGCLDAERKRPMRIPPALYKELSA